MKRHLVCADRQTGKILWTKIFDPELPEHTYSGEGSYHGYAASTPVSDGERLFVFFGKSGVYCFDLDGKQLWHQTVGKGQSGWGSGASPVLYKNMLISRGLPLRMPRAARRMLNRLASSSWTWNESADRTARPDCSLSGAGDSTPMS